MDYDSSIYLIGKTKGHLESSLFYEHLKIFGGRPQKLISKKKKKRKLCKIFSAKNRITNWMS